MAKMDDRMEMIGSAILGQAKEEARELIDKANAVREQEISSFEKQVVDNMFNEVQVKANSLRLASVKAVARNQLEAHRTLLSHRSEKTGQVLDAVRERLINYAKTPQYKENTLKRADEVKSRLDHSGSVIMVSDKDSALGEEIRKTLGNGTVKIDTSITLGGFRIRNDKEHILIDETLDERLDEQKQWLLENCGLKIV